MDKSDGGLVPTEPRESSSGLNNRGGRAFTQNHSPNVCDENQFYVINWGELNREDLLERLTEAGYNRSPLVEDAGDFSVRGFIIDLYPPFYLYPVRIEQDGDRIESIRFFDPTNQRSLGDVSEIQVGPVHMLIPDSNSRQEGLKQFARGLRRSWDRKTPQTKSSGRFCIWDPFSGFGILFAVLFSEHGISPRLSAF